MTLKLKSTSDELWRGWKLAWYHHFTQIACAKKLRVLRQKLGVLRVQNGQSLSKYKGFARKLICLQRDIFWTYLNSRLFVCSKWTIQSHIINFQPFLTSSVFTFSSLVPFAYCVITMDILHHLTGCLGQPWLWREEFHETFHNL